MSAPTPVGAEPRLPVVFMFSGQGSQYYGMGKELFDSNEVFRAALRRHDAVVSRYLGESVLDHVFDPRKPRNHPLADTRITHPAIVMIELALAETLRAEGIEPDHVLGSSLGEYAAAVVAGSLSADDCLRVLVRQAGIMEGSPRGGMLAVLAGPEVMDTVPGLRACEVAARNYPGNFVVAGTEDELAAAEAGLRAADVLHLRLPVEYAFHSRLLDPVVGACRDSFEGVALTPPRVPWISCVSGGPVTEVTAEHFWAAARRTIDFERALAGLRARGDFLYLDLGPSGSLHNFVRAMLPEGARDRSLPLLSQFARDTDLLAEVRTRAVPPPGTRAAAPPPPTRAAPTAPPATPAPTTPRKVHGMKVYGFPGQGSQRRGMGRGLFERFPRETAAADEVLGYSIEELCLTDPQRRLGRTEFTQPALYVVGALSYLERIADDPVPPDHVIGHSLGEYVALFAAGVFDFATGLRLVRRRGELMAAAGGGAMAAVVGVDEATVTRVLADAGLDDVDVANHNALDQFVVSGPGERIDVACAAFDAAGARTVRLHVSAPLHSRYMRPAAEEFGRFLDGVTLHPPRIPVLANVDARPYTADTVRERLTAQIASPVRWTDTVRTLMAQGDFEFTELGPGRVLTKLVTRIRDAAEPLTPAPAAARPSAGAAAPADGPAPDAGALGARGFRERYGLRRSYVVGSMYGGISGRELVRAASKAGLLGFLGIGGLEGVDVERQLSGLADELGPYGHGVNLLYPHRAPEREATLVDALLRHGVGLVEASGYPFVTEDLVRFRLKGGRILAKVTRTDLAAAFLAPPPERLVAALLGKGAVTREEAAAAAGRPLADDLCVEADGGWLTGTAGPLTLLPAVLRLRDEAALPGHRVHVGCAGGIGTPEAAAAAFLMGADFVLTGSVNQCTVEAATSDAVKDLLQAAQEYDVDTAPWGDLFEHGAQARYLKRGQFFPARASRLHDLWRRHASLADLDDTTRRQVFDRYLGGERPADLVPGPDPKADLAAAFRAYFRRGFRLAVTGDQQATVDYLVHCGPAMGAFNQSVAGTSLHPWRARTVEAVADHLMDGAADRVAARLRALRPA
ncbi:ACP S-malonyltransferase [Streptomyces luteocolor]|uniref:ACP S-malonyltransferase n=1 Tax=Streptomyces luteocolor TaxID=285500 RepID=UPI0008530534|nr:ACP S-malonyltransferase [Streptomyces luteocolor]